MDTTQARNVANEIRQALFYARGQGIRVDAVFISSELRYRLAALPDSPLRFTMEEGENIYGTRVIRFIDDDMSRFFLARAYPTEQGEPANEIYRPFLNKEVS